MLFRTGFIAVGAAGLLPWVRWALARGASAGGPAVDAQQGLCEGVAAAVPDLGSLPVDGGGHEPVVAAPLRDHREILAVEIEHPVPLCPRRRACVAAEHGRLFISQDLHRHDRNIAPTS